MKASASFYGSELRHSDVLSVLLLGDVHGHVVAWVDGDCDHLPLHANDLSGLCLHVDAAVTNLVKEVSQGLLIGDLPSRLLDPENGLATRGYAVRTSVLEPVSAKIRERKAGTIEFISEGFVLPWDLVFELPPRKAAGLPLREIASSFWGCAKVLGRRFPRPLIQSPAQRSTVSPLRVGVVANINVPGVESEIEELTELQAGGVIVLHRFEPRPEWGPFDTIYHLNSFLSRSEFDVVHFACHAVVSREDPLATVLEVTNGFRYLLSHLDQEPAVNVSAPLVFLNACSTGTGGGQASFSIVESFQRHGARNVIAVESAVESTVAALFSRRVYGKLASGESVGEALRWSKLESLSLTADNPATSVVALFYALYGDVRFSFS